MKAALAERGRRKVFVGIERGRPRNWSPFPPFSGGQGNGSRHGRLDSHVVPFQPPHVCRWGDVSWATRGKNGFGCPNGSQGQNIGGAGEERNRCRHCTH